MLLVLLVAIGSAGCKESNESIMMAHLQEKYPGQEFVKLRVGKAGYFGTGVPYMTCYPDVYKRQASPGGTPRLNAKYLY